MPVARWKLHQSRVTVLHPVALVLAVWACLPGAASAADDVDALLRRHAELTARLDELDTSVRARIRRDLLDQIDAWRAGLDDFDSDEFRSRLAQALEAAQIYGMDVARLERLYKASREVVLRADYSAQTLVSPSGPLERLSQFINWAGAEDARLAEAAAAAQQYRVEMHRRLALSYLEALLERDPGAAVEKFRAYGDALRTIASAEADALAAEVEALGADLQYVEDIAWGMPLLGDAMDIVALIEGRTPITGETLEGLDWALTLVGVAIGPVDQLVKRVPLAQATIDEAVAIARELVEPLVASGRYSRDQLAALINRFDGGGNAALLASRDQSRRELAVLNDQSISRFKQSPEGQDATRLWERANAEGALKVKAGEARFAELAAQTGGDPEQLRRLIQDGAQSLEMNPQWAELTQAYVALRQDKRAVGVLKDADPSLREKVFDFEEALFGRVEVRNGVAVNLGDGYVDQQVMMSMERRLQLAFSDSRFASDHDREGARQIEAWLRRHAAEAGDGNYRLESYVDPQKPRFEVFNATNTPPARGDIGADRDITYQLILNDGTRIDVPASFVEPHYDAALYQALHGATSATPEQRRQFVQAMDHAVTDGYVPEAYRPGMEVSEFLTQPGIRVGAAGAEDLASTIAYKGQEWFERGHVAMVAGKAAQGWTHVAEGMRQLTKQYDNQVLPRLAVEGLTETANVPPMLGKAIDLMKRVTYPLNKLPFGATRLGPAEAEAAILDMGFSSLDDVASQLGLFFEALEKSRAGGRP